MPGRDYQSGSETKEKFVGKELDTETGWYDLEARLYIPALGRFPVVDPLWKFSPGKTSYHYSSNDPVNRLDPNGLQDTDQKEKKAKKKKSLLDKLIELLKSILPFKPPDPNLLPPEQVDTKEATDEAEKAVGGEDAQETAETILLGSKNGETPTPDLNTKIIEDIVSGRSKKIKKLNDSEIKSLEEQGVDVHDLKVGGKEGYFDLYKDKKGNIYVFRKGGKGEGEYTGYNIIDFKK